MSLHGLAETRDARDWAPDKALYAWGPAVPKAFVHPDDVDDIAAALQGVS